MSFTKVGDGQFIGILDAEFKDQEAKKILESTKKKIADYNSSNNKESTLESLEKNAN